MTEKLTQTDLNQITTCIDTLLRMAHKSAGTARAVCLIGQDIMSACCDVADHEHGIPELMHTLGDDTAFECRDGDDAVGDVHKLHLDPLVLEEAPAAPA